MGWAIYTGFGMFVTHFVVHLGVYGISMCIWDCRHMCTLLGLGQIRDFVFGDKFVLYAFRNEGSMYI